MKGLFLAGFVVLGATAFAGTVDDFMTGSYNSGSFTSGSVSAWTSASSALGGIRYDVLTITDNPFVGDAKTRVITTPGILEVSTDTDVDTTFTLGYGYALSSTSPASNELNVNWTSTPLLSMTFRSNDIAQNVTATIYTNGGASSYTRTLGIAGGIVPASPQTYMFDFTSDAASLGDVDAVKFDFDPAPGADFSLTGINSVPEPASIAALAIGAAALLRRKKK
ncbi:MAG: PEP-CTERM sorting domain-containing protein [Armatimonadetes bacterium]|nr:PEP-CTERM sorting domain-containing protein [Armatimonadota bacterium]MBS1726102.1 PEP-CTERM sorting domain-containing protein [Armatimonadota bacterium]